MTTKYPKEFPIAIKMLDKAQSKLCEPIAYDGDRNWISRCKYAIDQLNEVKKFLENWLQENETR